jgi:exosortase
MVTVADGGARAANVPGSSWIKVLVLAGAFLWLTAWQYPTLVQMWLHDSNWSHGFIIPLFSLFLLYQRWSEVSSVRRRSCWLGLPVMILGILAMLLSVFPVKNTWLSQLSMTVILFGLVLSLAGPQMTRLTWVPIFYLVLAMPIPDTLYTRIAYPLQELAASASAGLLRMLGAQISVVASRMEVTGQSGTVHGLTVAEACSGVRSLMAFVALGVAMAYITDRPIWQRIVLMLFILPVAIFCNILRVAGTCWMYVIDKPELGQRFMHKFMGMAMLVPAGLLFLLLSWVLKSLFVEVDEAAAGPQALREGKGAR